MPARPTMPARAPRIRMPIVGAPPPTSTTHTARTGRLAGWDSTVTASGREVCVALPPEKSPTPHTTAERAASTMGSTRQLYHYPDREGQPVDRSRSGDGGRRRARPGAPAGARLVTGRA